MHRGLPRVGVFGWGVVAPKSPSIIAFEKKFPAGFAGKLSMGIGGINACVISRPLESDLP